MNKIPINELIDKIVQKRLKEELNRLLPRLVESFLSEKYLTRLIQERVNFSKSIVETLSDDEEEVTPKVLPNAAGHGIYNNNKLIKSEEKVEVARQKLIEENPAFREIYENLDYASLDQNHAVNNVSEKQLGQLFDLKRMQQLAATTINRPARMPGQIVTPRILEEKRKKLDQIFIGAERQPSVVNYSEDDPFEQRMQELDRRLSMK